MIYILFFLLCIVLNLFFDWIKEKLFGVLIEGFLCLKCSKIWNIDDLIEKCKMFLDE